jgi:hypothetical protein
MRWLIAPCRLSKAPKSIKGRDLSRTKDLPLRYRGLRKASATTNGHPRMAVAVSVVVEACGRTPTYHGDRVQRWRKPSPTQAHLCDGHHFQKCFQSPGVCQSMNPRWGQSLVYLVPRWCESSHLLDDCQAYEGCRHNIHLREH